VRDHKTNMKGEWIRRGAVWGNLFGAQTFRRDNVFLPTPKRTIEVAELRRRELSVKEKYTAALK